MLFLTFFMLSCGSSPIRGTFISNSENIWIDEPGGLGLSYCLSNQKDSKAVPVCYPARRGFFHTERVEGYPVLVPPGVRPTSATSATSLSSSAIREKPLTAPPVDSSTTDRRSEKLLEGANENPSVSD